MRLQQYYKYWSRLYDCDVNECVNETINLSTEVKKKADGLWEFWIHKDLYVVKALQYKQNCYTVSFSYKDYFDDDVSSITNKLTPFSVLDGVAVVIKNLIEEKNPKIIRFTVYNIQKKVDVFRRVTKSIINKHSNIFGSYKLTERVVELDDVPADIGRIEDIEFTLKRVE
jgi:hypothetical protein